MNDHGESEAARLTPPIDAAKLDAELLAWAVRRAGLTPMRGPALNLKGATGPSGGCAAGLACVAGRLTPMQLHARSLSCTSLMHAITETTSLAIDDVLALHLGWNGQVLPTQDDPRQPLWNAAVRARQLHGL